MSTAIIPLPFCVYHFNSIIHFFRTLEDILIELGQGIKHHAYMTVHVTRENVLEVGENTFKKKKFDATKKLGVVFLGGEEGIDTGGPTREFLRLLVAEVANLLIFEGPAGSRMLTLESTGKYLFSKYRYLITKASIVLNFKP